jgi:uncharacterized protein (UPF0276 family)
MKHLIYALTLILTLSFLSSSAYAPTEYASYEALRGCLKKIRLMSLSETLIYCSQTGTLYHNMNELNGRGWEMKLLS